MNIIDLAKQAGLHIATDVNWMPIISLEYAEKFANLVAAHEREACAKLVEPSEEHRRDALWGYIGRTEGVELLTAWKIAKAIRARGTT